MALCTYYRVKRKSPNCLFCIQCLMTLQTPNFDVMLGRCLDKPDKRFKVIKESYNLHYFDRNVHSGLLPRPNMHHVQGGFKSTYCSLKSTHILHTSCTHSQTNIHNHSLSWLSFAKQSTFKLSCDLPMLYAHLPGLISSNLKTTVSE